MSKSETESRLQRSLLWFVHFPCSVDHSYQSRMLTESILDARGGSTSYPNSPRLADVFQNLLTSEGYVDIFGVHCLSPTLLICISSGIPCGLIIRVDGDKILIRKLDLGLSWVYNINLPVIEDESHEEWNVDKILLLRGRWKQTDLEFSKVLIRQAHNVRDRGLGGLWALRSRRTGRFGKVSATRRTRRLWPGRFVGRYWPWVAWYWFACSSHWILLFWLLPAHLDRHFQLCGDFQTNMWLCNMIANAQHLMKTHPPPQRKIKFYASGLFHWMCLYQSGNWAGTSNSPQNHLPLPAQSQLCF